METFCERKSLADEMVIAPPFDVLGSKKFRFGAHAPAAALSWQALVRQIGMQ
jgi:hypothetical protein